MEDRTVNFKHAVVSVANGPSILELQAAVALGDHEHRYPVYFTIVDPTDHSRVRNVITVIVNGMTREDGSGHNWLINGWIDHNSVPEGFAPLDLNFEKANYSTKNRVGTITLNKK